MLLFYIRHGDPIYDPDSLTPLGERQAEAVARRLSQHGIDRVFSSPSKRAVQTTKPLCEIVKKEMEILDFCDEGISWGDFSLEYEGRRRTWFFVIPELKKLLMSK